MKWLNFWTLTEKRLSNGLMLTKKASSYLESLQIDVSEIYPSAKASTELSRTSSGQQKNGDYFWCQKIIGEKMQEKLRSTLKQEESKSLKN